MSEIRVGDFVYIGCTRRFGTVGKIEEREWLDSNLAHVKLSFDHDLFSVYGTDKVDESWCCVVDDEWAEKMREKNENWIRSVLAIVDDLKSKTSGSREGTR